ncbi:DNA-binding response regulator [Actinomadura craniellae]|uniref:DNA-binding response regulator n=1 Tax=Actinomadura craniellae TaxID=2231787 RepID=A0A365HBF5_9ACTN|nr:response regulator transcription factor [Actinomadura craniellae]RAY16484.1 DNA-binding response regulator [Actinomadura craniellae]
MNEAAGVVLVVEPEPGVAELARLYLAREGFDVRIEGDPAQAGPAAARVRPDAVVLDLTGTPRPAELYRKVAAAAGAAPVVCVVDDSVPPGVGEHRVSRPYGPRLLVAAVGEALRGEGEGEGPGLLRLGGVTIDPRTRTVHVGDRPVALTATEFDLLAFLVASPGRVFSREQLLAAAWGPEASAGARTVDVHIAQLRGKLGPASPIRTVRGVGYAAGP